MIGPIRSRQGKQPSWTPSRFWQRRCKTTRTRKPNPFLLRSRSRISAKWTRAIYLVVRSLPWHNSCTILSRARRHTRKLIQPVRLQAKRRRARTTLSKCRTSPLKCKCLRMASAISEANIAKSSMFVIHSRRYLKASKATPSCTILSSYPVSCKRSRAFQHILSRSILIIPSRLTGEASNWGTVSRDASEQARARAIKPTKMFVRCSGWQRISRRRWLTSTQPRRTLTPSRAIHQTVTTTQSSKRFRSKNRAASTGRAPVLNLIKMAMRAGASTVTIATTIATTSLGSTCQQLMTTRHRLRTRSTSIGPRIWDPSPTPISDVDCTRPKPEQRTTGRAWACTSAANRRSRWAHRITSQRRGDAP